MCKTRFGDKVLVLADTKAEWMVTALSCFQAGCTVVTLYTTMSDEAIKYGLEQTEAAVIFTDQDILPRLTSILKGTLSIFVHQKNGQTICSFKL